MEQATFLTCDETMAEDNDDNTRQESLIPRVDERFGAHIAFETPSDNGAIIMSLRPLLLS